MNADWLYPMRKQDSTAKTLVFLGDSITASGEYIRFIEACLQRQRGTLRAELLGRGGTKRDRVRIERSGASISAALHS